MILPNAVPGQSPSVAAGAPLTQVNRPPIVPGQSLAPDAAADRDAREGPGLQGWTEWLIARRGETCNHGWSGHVRHIALPDGWEHWDLPPEQEERVIDVLFSLLDEYLAEREADSTP